MSYAIISIIKDENEYLDEWIRYHLDMGISNIFLYEDIGSESHDEIVSKYPQVSLHSVLDFYDDEDKKSNAKEKRLKKIYMQTEFFKLALIKAKKDIPHDWAFLIDTDEFITLEDKTKTIEETLEPYKDYDVLMIDWMNFNSNNHIEKPIYDKGIWEIYTERCGSSEFDTRCMKFSKMVINIEKYDGISFNGVHGVKKNSNAKWCRTDFTSKLTTEPCYKAIYLRHYITKSFEEYAWKLKVRGMSHLTHRRLEEYFQYNPNLLDRKEELLLMIDRIKVKDKIRYILISGICGFIGFHTARLILQRFPKAKIVGIDNMNDQYDVSLKEERLKLLQDEFGDRLSFERGDICDKEFVNSTFNKYSPQIVIHLAGMADTRASISNPYPYIETNVMGFANILEACRHSRDDEKRGVRKVIYASSSTVYGNKTNFMSRESDASDKQLSPYGATKKMDEVLAEMYSNVYEIPCVGLRFFTVYGEYGRPTMAYYMFADKIVNGDRIELYNSGNNTRDFTYVGDVAECIARICKDVESGEHMENKHTIYNIGNSSSVKVSDIVTYIINSLYKNGMIENNTHNRIRLRGGQKGDAISTLADTSKFFDDYGFKPNTPIRDGIERFIKWYKERTSAK